MNLRLSDQCFVKFIDHIHHLTGIAISVDRKTMVESRIRKRVVMLNMESYEDYLTCIQADADESREFIDLITTNETYFFRTPRVWKYLEETFLPEWFEQHPRNTFKAWSAASSSGEEAHSLGVLCEAFKDANPGFQYLIVGSDISKSMVERCHSGLYAGRSIRAFRNQRPEWLSRYMETYDGENYQVVSSIKNRLRFREHNLFHSPPMKDSFDLILLRNVLIYFQPQDQEKVVSLIHTRLATDGRLIIGESESLSHINTKFRKIDCYIYEPMVNDLSTTQTSA